MKTNTEKRSTVVNLLKYLNEGNASGHEIEAEKYNLDLLNEVCSEDLVKYWWEIQKRVEKYDKPFVKYDDISNLVFYITPKGIKYLSDIELASSSNRLEELTSLLLAFTWILEVFAATALWKNLNPKAEIIGIVAISAILTMALNVFAFWVIRHSTFK